MRVFAGGVVFATGTPISNSMSELFVMQRYLQPQELKRMGLELFDSWAASFGDIVSTLEIKPEGNGYRMRQRFAKFNNLPELMNVFRQVADIQTADMLGLPTPEIEGGKPFVVSAEITTYQQALMDDFVERADKIHRREVEPYEDNMLKITGEARLMSIDPRLVYPDAPNDPGTKLNLCIENVYKVWEQTAADRLTQLVFCDCGTPRPGRFNVYHEMKRVLTAKGIPAEEIAFIHDAKNEAQRDALFDKVRAGQVRVLLGSTSKLGTGVNVQKKLIAVHDLDCPWKPSDIEQRHGRILRQGNDNPVVQIYQYVTKGTFDSYLWQIQEQKLLYITQVMSGKSVSRSCDDMDELVLSAAEVKAVASGDPMVKEKCEVDNEVERLKLLRSSWQNEQASLQKNLDRLPQSISSLEIRGEKIEKDIALLSRTEGQDFRITIDGTVFSDRVKAGERLLALAKAIEWATWDEHPEAIGEYRGLKLHLRPGFFADSYDMILKGAHEYKGELGESAIGVITRIENLSERLPRFRENAGNELDELRRQLAAAKESLGKPFTYEDELQRLTARQAEINAHLEFKELKDQEEVVLDEENQLKNAEQDVVLALAGTER